MIFFIENQWFFIVQAKFLDFTDELLSFKKVIFIRFVSKDKLFTILEINFNSDMF